MPLALLPLLLVCLGPALIQSPGGTDAPHPGMRHVAASTPEALADWAGRVDRLVDSGALVLRERRRGPETRLNEWFVQHYQGVPVAGGEVWRRTEGGKVMALEGTLYEDVSVDVRPGLDADEAREAFGRLDARGLGPSLAPQLVVLPAPDGSYVLAYAARLFADGALSLVYLDATTGREVLRIDEPGPPASRTVSREPATARRRVPRHAAGASG